MSEELYNECLKMPALRRATKVLRKDPIAHRRRVEDENLSNLSRRTWYEDIVNQKKKKTDKDHQKSLEESIKRLRGELRAESERCDIQALAVKRVRQTKIPETPYSRACIAERDELCKEILDLQQKLRDLDEADERDQREQASLMDQIKSFEIKIARRKQEQRNAWSPADLQYRHELEALRKLFFALIM